jgi:glycosyltransferase involved in cell wall biosynthesis
MRVLIVTQIYLPEMGALANRLYPIVRALTAAGHEVFVATGMPNYPEGVVFPGYRGKRSMRETIDGATVLRTSYYTAPRNQSKRSQLQSYMSFVPAVFRSGLMAGKVDVVFVTSPPLFPAVAAIALAKLWGARLVLDLRDLWPDEIVACGAAREGSLPVRIVRALERRAYRIADRVCCTTQRFIQTVLERGVSREKVFFLPNGADLELFQPLPADHPVVAEYPFGNRFVAMYSGALGIKHGLETVLEAARLLRHEESILFFLLGGGARRKALMERAQELKLTNVIFGGERSVSEVPHLLARADVCLSACLSEEYLAKIISVKIFEYLACGKAVVAAQTGESASVLEESGAGVVVPPGDARAMADAILSLSRDPERCVAMGQRGRQFVEQNYSRSVWAARLEEMLRALAPAPTLGARLPQEIPSIDR